MLGVGTNRDLLLQGVLLSSAPSILHIPIGKCIPSPIEVTHLYLSSVWGNSSISCLYQVIFHNIYRKIGLFCHLCLLIKAKHNLLTPATLKSIRALVY